MSIANRLRFCKTCCQPYFYICPRDLVRCKYTAYLTTLVNLLAPLICNQFLINVADKTQLKAHREGHDNFIFISTKCIADLYHWTQEHVFKRLRADNFLWSIVMSTFLFAIGIKLNLELNAWNLPKTTGR
ncbi:PREDICTED: uncharacterized protein LOC106746024 [Dinoponera quadriceps]|uniref:Uncharacterized protein LOC106746024 n=1 Tax=Dinoponera quadriceps TaxID=609295 RepID=A0A6P3XI15_DINQU|nr:PREDICTED: uncharacterized protein LOC106746024 [Dinoponera quadriceps]